MANIYKNEKTSLTTTALTTLYTVPSNSRAIVKSLLVVEDASGSAVVKVTLTNASGTAFVVDNDVTLTSGQKEKAMDGLVLLEQLKKISKNRILIMPGSGISEMNFMKFNSFKEIHGSFKDGVPIIN